MLQILPIDMLITALQKQFTFCFLYTLFFLSEACQSSSVPGKVTEQITWSATPSM